MLTATAANNNFNETRTSTTMSTKNPSLPLKPLWDLARVQADIPDDGLMTAGTMGFTAVLFAEMVGTTSRAVTRWRKEGQVPWLSADEAAVNLGLHPILVWGDDWLNVKGDFEALQAEAHAEMENALIEQIADEALDGDWS
jgi:hypothetical protein